MTPVGSLAVAAPPRVRDRLHAAPDGPVTVVHRGEHALYVDVGGWCVGVVTRGAARVPCALRPAVDHFPAGLAADPVSAYVEAGTLHVDARRFPVSRLEGTSVPRLDLEALLASDTRSLIHDPAPPAVAGFVASTLPGGRVDPRTAAGLIGAGEGLTPLGDDLLAGWLAMHRAVGVATPEVDSVVVSHSPRTTLLSATLLDCAVHGEVLPEFAAWVRALGTPDAPARARDLAAVGATSGAGLLHGARIALHQRQETA